MAKTFRNKTILNSDDVYITKDQKNIHVRKVWSVEEKNKKGQVVGWKTYDQTKSYPNTKSNRSKAERLIGKIRNF